MSCANNEIDAPYISDTCSGLILQRTPPGHPEQPLQGTAPASLAIDYIAAGEPPGTSNLMFKMKVTDLSSVPPNSRWRIVWNSYAAQSFDPAAEQFYAGMRTDQNGTVTFEYGTVATAVWVWLSVSRQKLQSELCLEAALMLMERSRSSSRNPRSEIHSREICSELLMEGRSPAIRARLKTWSGQLCW